MNWINSFEILCYVTTAVFIFGMREPLSMRFTDCIC